MKRLSFTPTVFLLAALWATPASGHYHSFGGYRSFGGFGGYRTFSFRPFYFAHSFSYQRPLLLNFYLESASYGSGYGSSYASSYSYAPPMDYAEDYSAYSYSAPPAPLPPTSLDALTIEHLAGLDFLAQLAYLRSSYRLSEAAALLLHGRYFTRSGLLLERQGRLNVRALQRQRLRLRLFHHRRW